MNSKESTYRDYWKDPSVDRRQDDYYTRLYAHIKPKIKIRPNSRTLDVGGGSGQNLLFFRIKDADVLDISDSGLAQAEQNGFNPIKGDVQARFPIEENTYDNALCFEILEHLHHPNITLSETYNVLKSGGILYLAIPNMRPDGVIHVRRYHIKELLDDLSKCGFNQEWVDYVPAYTMRDAILSDIRKNPSIIRRLIQCINLMLSFLPWQVRYQMAQWVPDRFALLFVVKMTKK